jgi:hypothetical protein
VREWSETGRRAVWLEILLERAEYIGVVATMGFYRTSNHIIW